MGSAAETMGGDGEGLEPGMRIEVRRRFDQRWSKGFEVAEVLEDGSYRVKRISDGTVLPAEFAADDIRAERKRKQGLWWY